MRLKCPRCSMVVEGEPGSRITCPACSFTAIVPGGAPQGAPATPSYVPATPPPRPAASTAPQYMTPPPMGAPAAPPNVINPNHGPIGKRRDPWVVVILCVITLSIYFFVWAWKVSKEMDDFMARPKASHGKMKAGIILLLIGGVLAIISFVAMLGPVIQQLMVDPEAEPTVDPAQTGIGVLLLLVGLGLLVAGWILQIIAFWRMWKMMEEDEQRRLSPKPFNPTVTLLLVILGMFVPYVGWIVSLAAYWITQDGLNRIWSAYGGMPRMA